MYFNKHIEDLGEGETLTTMDVNNNGSLFNFGVTINMNRDGWLKLIEEIREALDKMEI